MSAEASGDCLDDDQASESLLATAVRVEETPDLIPTKFPPEPLLDPPAKDMADVDTVASQADIDSGQMAEVECLIMFAEQTFIGKDNYVIKFHGGILEEFCEIPMQISGSKQLSKEDRKRVEYWKFADPISDRGGARASVFARCEKGMSHGRAFREVDNLNFQFNQYLDVEKDYDVIYDKMLDRFPEAMFHLWEYPDLEHLGKYERYEQTPELTRAENHAMGEFSSMDITMSQAVEFDPPSASTQSSQKTVKPHNNRTMHDSSADLFSVADGVIHHTGGPGTNTATGKAGAKPAEQASKASGNTGGKTATLAGATRAGAGGAADGGGSDDEDRRDKKQAPAAKPPSDLSEESSKKKGGKRPRGKRAEDSTTETESIGSVAESPKKKPKRLTKNQKLEAELAEMRAKEAVRAKEQEERDEQRRREFQEMQEKLNSYEKNLEFRKRDAQDTVNTLAKLKKDEGAVEAATGRLKGNLTAFREIVEADVSAIPKIPSGTPKDLEVVDIASSISEQDNDDDEVDPVSQLASQMESASEGDEEDEPPPTLTRTDSSMVLVRAEVHEPPRPRTPPKPRHATPNPTPSPNRPPTPRKAVATTSPKGEPSKKPAGTSPDVTSQMPPPAKIPTPKTPPSGASATAGSTSSKGKGKGKGASSQGATAATPTNKYSCNPMNQPFCRCESMTLEEMRADMTHQPSQQELFHRLFYITDVEGRSWRRKARDLEDTQERIIKNMKSNEKERKQTLDMSKSATQAASEAAKAVTQASQAMSSSQEAKDEIRARREAMCVKDEQMLRLPFRTWHEFWDAWTDWEKKEAIKRLFFSVRQVQKHFPGNLFLKLFDIQLDMRLLMPLPRAKEISGFPSIWRFGERNFPIPNDFLDAVMHHMDKELDSKDPRTLIRTHLNDMRAARNNQIKAILAKHVNGRRWNDVNKFYLLIALDDERGWNICRKPAPLYTHNTDEERAMYYERYEDRFIARCKETFARLAYTQAADITIKKEKGLGTKKLIPATIEPEDEEGTANLHP